MCVIIVRTHPVTVQWHKCTLSGLAKKLSAFPIFSIRNNVQKIVKIIKVSQEKKSKKVAKDTVSVGEVGYKFRGGKW